MKVFTTSSYFLISFSSHLISSEAAILSCVGLIYKVCSIERSCESFGLVFTFDMTFYTFLLCKSVCIYLLFNSSKKKRRKISFFSRPHLFSFTTISFSFHFFHFFAFRLLSSSHLSLLMMILLCDFSLYIVYSLPIIFDRYGHKKRKEE